MFYLWIDTNILKMFYIIQLILWLSIIIIVTFLHKMRLIDEKKNNYLICFSIIKNYQSIIWRKNDSSFKNNKMDLLNGIRVLQQIYIILFHIGCFIDLSLNMDNKQIENNSNDEVNIWPFGPLILWHGLDIAFIVSGISSAKWFIQKYNKSLNKDLFKLSIRFITTRVIRIIPIYYLSLYCYIILIRYYLTDKTRDILVENSCTNNWYLNALFLQTFFSADDMVK